MEIIDNVIANIVAVVVLAIIGAIIIAFYRTLGIKRFFGIAAPRSGLRIFLSAIPVKQGGSIGTARIEQGFFGEAITEIEYRSALSLYAALRGGPSTWFFTTVFGSRASADRATSEIEKSPSFWRYHENDRDDETTEVNYKPEDVSTLYRQSCSILIGAPIYNLLTHHLMRVPKKGEPKSPHPFFQFIRDFENEKPVRGIKVIQEPNTEERKREETPTYVQDYFIVSRIDLGDKRRAFIAAGTCTAATAAAVNQLVKWRQFKKFKGDFGVLYGIRLPAGGREVQLGPQDLKRRTSVLRELS